MITQLQWWRQMLSHAITQTESGSLWRPQCMQDTGVSCMKWTTRDSILLLQINHSIAARVYGQLGARHHLLLLLLTVVFNFLLIFTTLLLLLLSLIIFSHPLRLLLLLRHLPLLLLQRPL